MLDPAQSEALAERLIIALERSMRRNVVARRRPRALMKTSVVTAAMPQALARQPDAKMIVLLRDPLEVIPSTMSLAEHMWLPRIRALHSPTEAQLSRYYEHLYQASQRMLMGLVHWGEAGLLPPERVLVVPYRRLVAEPEGVLGEVLRFAELPEAPVEGTLYRVLFLAGLLLFGITFVLNTIAEMVRLRFRKRFKGL